MGNSDDVKSDMKRKKSWYESRTVVVIFTIVLFPLGIYGLWKSSRFIKWKELRIIGRFWRVCWIFFALGLFSAFWSGEDSSNKSFERNLQKGINEQASQEVTKAQQKKPPKDVILHASFSHLSDENNVIWMNYHGNININLYKPQLRENDVIYSQNDNNVKMIGAEYFFNNKKRFYNNDSGTNIRLTLTNLNYQNRRAIFEFEALLHNSMRNNEKSVKVQFELTGKHFDNAVKAQVIATEGE